MKLKAVSGIMLTLLLIGMLTLAFDIQAVKAESSKPPVTERSKTYGGANFDEAYSPSEPVVNITVDKPFPQTYKFGETMHVTFIGENPLPEPVKVIFVLYFWLYPPIPWLMPITRQLHTMPAETVETFSIDVPFTGEWARTFPLWGYWIVAILDPSTMNIISWDYVLWIYTP